MMLLQRLGLQHAYFAHLSTHQQLTRGRSKEVRCPSAPLPIQAPSQTSATRGSREAEILGAHKGVQAGPDSDP